MNLSIVEAWWLKILGNFGIFLVSLKLGKIHVLGDSLFGAPHASVNIPEVRKIDLHDVNGSYEDDNF